MRHKVALRGWWPGRGVQVRLFRHHAAAAAVALAPAGAGALISCPAVHFDMPAVMRAPIRLP